MQVKVKVTLEQAMKAQRGSKILLIFINFGDWWGGWSAPCTGRFTLRKDSRHQL